MKILVTGGAGYLGSVLVPKLLARGHQVRVLDVGYFGIGHLRSLLMPVEIIQEDIRWLVSEPEFCQKVLDDCDCIIHLAAISNDPSAELNPKLAEEVNFQATKILAETAKAYGIRFLFASTCSVYGEAQGEMCENDNTNPLTVYAVSKVKAEQALKELADAHWSPVILRNGTLFGYSPRMRFDLVINIFSLLSFTCNEITVYGDGQQWRPFIHVNDCARAFVYFAERSVCHHLCYNIAHKNFRMIEVAKTFQKIKPNLQTTYRDLPEEDQRDYRVSNRRMLEEGFKTHTEIELGIEETVEAIVRNLIPNPNSAYYRNVKWLKELIYLGEKENLEILRMLEKPTRTFFRSGV